MSTPREIADLLKSSPYLVLLLDYDGTLAPIAQRPEQAVPDPELLALLLGLAGRASTSVHIVSGRPRDVLIGWFGDMPIALWAEHAAFHRPRPGAPWQATQPVPPGWHEPVMPLLEQAMAATPGSFIERKTATIAWHYRLADEIDGPRQAATLHRAVAALANGVPIDVLRGKKVVEIRLAGVSKASAAHHVLAGAAAADAILAIGDDETDEELFAALPERSMTVGVGRRACAARYRLRDFTEVRELLQDLLS